MKQSEHYKSYSPFNFFRDNIVFQVPKKWTLGWLAQEITGKNQKFVKEEGNEEQWSPVDIDSKAKIAELQDAAD